MRGGGGALRGQSHPDRKWKYAEPGPGPSQNASTPPLSVLEDEANVSGRRLPASAPKDTSGCFLEESWEFIARGHMARISGAVGQ